MVRMAVETKLGVTDDMSPASCNLIRSSMTLSSPSRRESNDREICPSCEVGSRFNDIARCLSSKDSLM